MDIVRDSNGEIENIDIKGNIQFDGDNGSSYIISYESHGKLDATPNITWEFDSFNRNPLSITFLNSAVG